MERQTQSAWYGGERAVGPHCERPCSYPEPKGTLGGFNHGRTVMGYVSWEANAMDTVEYRAEDEKTGGQRPRWRAAVRAPFF